jgi:hypothetical protein
MSNPEQIAAQRAALIERIAFQRAELGAIYSQFQRPAAIFDKGYALACGIKSHPGIAIGASAVLALALIKRGVIGKLACVSAMTAKFVVPIARFWLSRKLPP